MYIHQATNNGLMTFTRYIYIMVGKGGEKYTSSENHVHAKGVCETVVCMCNQGLPQEQKSKPGYILY